MPPLPRPTAPPPPPPQAQRCRCHGFHARIVENPKLLNYSTVYCMFDGSYIKVGKCKGHPKARMDDLQTGNPNVLRLLAWTCHWTERRAHWAFNVDRRRGEWFAPSCKLLAALEEWDWLDESLLAELRAAASGVPPPP